MDLIIIIVIIFILSLLASFIDGFLLDKGINQTRCIYSIYGMLGLVTMQQFL